MTTSKPSSKYLVVIDGAGEAKSDFSVIAVEASTPKEAVERVTATEMGYGRDEDGIAFVLPLGGAAVFRVNDTTRKQVSPASFDEVVDSTAELLRQFIDPDGGHRRA